MSVFLRRVRPTILTAVVGMVVLGWGGLMYEVPEVATAAIAGVAVTVRDIVASEDKMTDAEVKNGG